MYKILGTQSFEVEIGTEQILNVLNKMQDELLDGSGRYIEDNKICKDYKYHKWETDVIRDATEEEIEVYDALAKIKRYLRKSMLY